MLSYDLYVQKHTWIWYFQTQPITIHFVWEMVAAYNYTLCTANFTSLGSFLSVAWPHLPYLMLAFYIGGVVTLWSMWDEIGCMGNGGIWNYCWYHKVLPLLMNIAFMHIWHVLYQVLINVNPYGNNYWGQLWKCYLYATHSNTLGPMHKSDM